MRWELNSLYVPENIGELVDRLLCAKERQQAREVHVRLTMFVSTVLHKISQANNKRVK